MDGTVSENAGFGTRPLSRISIDLEGVFGYAIRIIRPAE